MEKSELENKLNNMHIELMNDEKSGLTEVERLISTLLGIKDHIENIYDNGKFDAWTSEELDLIYKLLQECNL